MFDHRWKHLVKGAESEVGGRKSSSKTRARTFWEKLFGNLDAERPVAEVRLRGCSETVVLPVCCDAP